MLARAGRATDEEIEGSILNVFTQVTCDHVLGRGAGESSRIPAEDGSITPTREQTVSVRPPGPGLRRSGIKKKRPRRLHGDFIKDPQAPGNRLLI
jgi:hypothetical protein